MAVAGSWEKEKKVAGLEVEPAYPSSKLGKSTRSIFRVLSEFGLCCCTTSKVHAHLQSLASHGNVPVSTQGRSVVYTGREVRWSSVWRESVASSVRHKIPSGRYDCTYGLPLFHAKRCFISPLILCTHFLTHCTVSATASTCMASLTVTWPPTWTRPRRQCGPWRRQGNSSPPVWCCKKWPLVWSRMRIWKRMADGAIHGTVHFAGTSPSHLLPRFEFFPRPQWGLATVFITGRILTFFESFIPKLLLLFL